MSNRKKRIRVKKVRGRTDVKSKKVATAAKKGVRARPVDSRAAKKRAKARSGAKAVVEEAMPAFVIVDGKKFHAVAEPLGVLCAEPAILEAPDMVVPFAASNRLTLLVAPAKAGKSTVMASVCAQLSTGGVLWGSPIPPSKVLWVGLEEWFGDCARRFMRMNADGINVSVVKSLGCDPLAQLRAEIVLGKPRLVVIDSFSRLAGGSVEDENNAAIVNKLLSPLVDFVHGCGAAVVMLHHTKKDGKGYRGSSALGAQVDVILEMTEDASDLTVRHFHAVGRIEIPAFSLRYDPDAATYEHLGEGPSQAAMKAQGQVDLAHKVVEHVRANPGQGSNAIRGVMGGRAVEIDAVLKSMVAAGTLQHNGRRGGYVVAAA